MLFELNKSRLQSATIENTRQLLKQANSYFSHDFLPPVITFDLRGKCAGQAVLNENKLRFNNELMLMYADLFIQETVAHELAHLIAHQLYGYSIKPHGREWSNIMTTVFNSDPKITHSFATTMHRKKIYLYRCLCRNRVEFSETRHKRVQKGTRYICKKCKSDLTYYRSR